ncbi:hypothetical protein [Paludisphaera rhizosphaerae]|uniref:hypothetical protein n=1 Tax=Paludisphaera rhizosphaerae TaxID=2711216 RepID=UPI0013EE05A3|nr:hypothetical protein [Paludisphaera rhizosphaerae]
MAGSGDWLVAEELFERGDPAFVDAVRRIDDADALGSFAGRWVDDHRPEARAMLLDYLDRPLNSYRHEALVKRAFKRAEAKQDDVLTAAFLVAFDRSIRRVRRTRWRFEQRDVATEEEARALLASWAAAGADRVNSWADWQGRHHVYSHWAEPGAVATPHGTDMPRGAPRDAWDWDPVTRRTQKFKVPDWVYRLRLHPPNFRDGGEIPARRRKDFAQWRLFSVATRHYLRRRAWRYFRRLGRLAPERYVPAVKEALLRYRDEDVATGLALIDNWGLVHILFHHSPVLVDDDRGWRLAPGKSLAELEPAPMFAKLWQASPRAIVEVITRSRCRAVRGWAVRMARRNPSAILPVFPVEELLGLLEFDEPEVVELAADLLRDHPDLANQPVEHWLSLLESAAPAALPLLTELVGKYVPAEAVATDRAVRLARMRPLPLARLGLRWLTAKPPRDEAECQALLGLVEAECEPMRPELLAWARQALAESGRFDPSWIVAWLDSRHDDARAEGWRWFLDEPRVRDDVPTWRKLMESPYDDVRLKLVTELEARARGTDPFRVERGDLNPELLRLLWASVLLNVERGHRAKPLAVRQLVRRAEARPEDLPALLPILAVALRSVRGPEFRSGLAAIVGLAERDENARALIARTLPELQMG